MVILYIYGARAIFLIFFVHKDTELEYQVMEIGVSQSIVTQKNMTGSTGPGYLSTTMWCIVWSNFQIFLDVETIFNLFGFQVFLFCIFLKLP